LCEEGHQQAAKRALVDTQYRFRFTAKARPFSPEKEIRRELISLTSLNTPGKEQIYQKSYARGGPLGERLGEKSSRAPPFRR
jgi:hypothetical protein